MASPIEVALPVYNFAVLPQGPPGDLALVRAYAASRRAEPTQDAAKNGRSDRCRRRPIPCSCIHSGVTCECCSCADDNATDHTHTTRDPAHYTCHSDSGCDNRTPIGSYNAGRFAEPRPPQAVLEWRPSTRLVFWGVTNGVFRNRLYL
jgi:hypothetical protein